MLNSSGETWGVFVNQRLWLHATGCPAWAKPDQQKKWRKQGVVLWCDATQTITHLGGGHALALLEQLHDSDDWKEYGCVVGEPAWLVSLDSPDNKGKTVLTNQMTLTSAQTAMLLDLLVGEEAALKQIALQEEDDEKRILVRVYSLILKSADERKPTIYDENLPWHENKRIMRERWESREWPKTLTSIESRLFEEMWREISAERQQAQLKSQERAIRIKKNLLMHRFFWDRIKPLWLQLRANERLHILQMLQDVEWDNNVLLEIRQIVENAQFFEALSQKSGASQEPQPLSSEELNLMLDIPDDELWQTLLNLYRKQSTASS